DMRAYMKGLNELQDMTRLREELARLNARINRFEMENVPRQMRVAQPQAVRALRYAGVIGGAEVGVRGAGTVIVSENDAKNEVVINTGESVIVIRASDLERALQKAKDAEKRRERPR